MGNWLSWPKTGPGSLFSQPGEPSAVLFAAAGLLVLLAAATAMLFSNATAGLGNQATLAQKAFAIYTRFGRLKNWLCCTRAFGKYPMANTCQIPWFKSLSDIYKFVFGDNIKDDGVFVEVGAYDGEYGVECRR